MGALFLPKSKKKAREEAAVIVFEDEASFRQSPTLYRTWARVNSQPKIPTKGQRNTQKVFGAVSLYEQEFVYRHQAEYFNAQTYLRFLEEQVLPSYYRRRHRVYLIHDNASYHKKPEVKDWLAKSTRRIEAFPLPPYSPEFNAIERIWHHVRVKATHNRYYECVAALCNSLFHAFGELQRHPESITGLLQSFF